MSAVVPAQRHFDEDAWDDLLNYIEERRVIPIIGPDLLRVQTDRGLRPLYEWLAEKLAVRLQVSTADLPQPLALNDVVCSYLGQRGRREEAYTRIRSILRDTTSFLPWAKEDYACVIFNLRTPHDAAGILRTANTFRALIDVSIELRGSFFLTYHRAASSAQVAACYPGFRQWLAKKLVYDPDQRFTSTWYTHYRDAFARENSR